MNHPNLDRFAVFRKTGAAVLPEPISRVGRASLSSLDGVARRGG